MLEYPSPGILVGEGDPKCPVLLDMMVEGDYELARRLSFKPTSRFELESLGTGGCTVLNRCIPVANRVPFGQLTRIDEIYFRAINDIALKISFTNDLVSLSLSPGGDKACSWI